MNDMRNKINIIFAAFLGMVFSFSSCEKNEPIVYDGPELVHLPVLSKTFTFSSLDESASYVGEVQRISDNADAALTYELAFLADTSTAVEGTHFDIANKTLEIKAGEYSGEFNLEFYPDAFEVGYPKIILLTITSESGTTANDTMKITVAKTLEYSVNNFEGTYDVVDVDDEGTETEYQISLAVHDAEAHEIEVTGLWEMPGIPIIMQLDGEAKTLTIPIQEYGCYNADTDYDPLCTILAAFTDRNTEITGEIIIDGSELVLTSGYTIYITTPPYETYYFTPAATISTWTKSESKIQIPYRPKDNLIMESL
jgi:hypothetical protein